MTKRNEPAQLPGRRLVAVRETRDTLSQLVSQEADLQERLAAIEAEYAEVYAA